MLHTRCDSLSRQKVERSHVGVTWQPYSIRATMPAAARTPTGPKVCRAAKLPLVVELAAEPEDEESPVLLAPPVELASPVVVVLAPLEVTCDRVVLLLPVMGPVTEADSVPVAREPETDWLPEMVAEPMVVREPSLLVDTMALTVAEAAAPFPDVVSWDLDGG
jgi:hypothetical protein